MSGGYIKLWRKSVESAVFRHEGVWHLFSWLLLTVSHEPVKTLLKVGNHAVLVELQPGQRAVRERLLADDLGISRNTLRRRFELLEQLEVIKREPHRDYILITVTNWEHYQSQVCAGSEIEPPHGGGGSKTEPPAEPPAEPHNKKRRSKEIIQSRKREFGTKFDEWYAEYPRHEDRKKAEPAYVKAVTALIADNKRHPEIRTADQAHEFLVDRAKRYAAECARREPHWIKLPASWLNAGSYDNAPQNGNAKHTTTSALDTSKVEIKNPELHRQYLEGA